jgi:hypothetical protein
MADVKVKTAVLEALAELDPDDLRELFKKAGLEPVTPSTSLDALEGMLGRIGQTNVAAIREARKLDRKENPNYPERSVFLPRGLYDDEGRPQPPKLKLTHVTHYCGQPINGESETEEEIALFNRFTESKESRDGKWKAQLTWEGKKSTLMITVPARSIDDRSELPAMTQVLTELLDGPDAVNPDTMAKRIAALEATIQKLTTSAA